MSANSRELRLARRALRAARTHLSQARGLVSMSEETREAVWVEMMALLTMSRRVGELAVEADVHLERQVRARRDAKRRAA